MKRMQGRAAKRSKAQFAMVAQFVLLVLIVPKESANGEIDSRVGKDSVQEVYCHSMSFLSQNSAPVDVRAIDAGRNRDLQRAFSVLEQASATA